MLPQLIKVKNAWIENRKLLLWLFVTYMPVSGLAAYLGNRAFGNYIAGFTVAGAYGMALLGISFRMMAAVREEDEFPSIKFYLNKVD